MAQLCGWRSHQLTLSPPHAEPLATPSTEREEGGFWGEKEVRGRARSKKAAAPLPASMPALGDAWGLRAGLHTGPPAPQAWTLAHWAEVGPRCRLPVPASPIPTTLETAGHKPTGTLRKWAQPRGTVNWDSHNTQQSGPQRPALQVGVPPVPAQPWAPSAKGKQASPRAPAPGHPAPTPHCVPGASASSTQECPGPAPKPSCRELSSFLIVRLQ